MKALILNSGIGKRMGLLTNKHPKCMVEIDGGETILSRQLKQLCKCGITEIVMTTGAFEKMLIDYCYSLDLPLVYTFVNNSIYEKTNYIYSIYIAREYLEDDIALLHGDLVFAIDVLQDVLNRNESCMAVSSAIPLPTKDFKAVIRNNLIEKIGVNFFDNALAAQPLYKINKPSWRIWLERIIIYCERGQVSCYAEDAFNEISHRCPVYTMDYTDRLCSEIDTPEDLAIIKSRLKFCE